MSSLKSSASLLWMMSRPAPGNKAVIALPAVAFALVTALLLIVLAGARTFFINLPSDDQNGTAGIYQMLAIFALALMLLPMLALGGSAARLSARRRDERLSTLRLLGATPALVTVLTVVESTLVALVGVLSGLVLYALTVPAIALIRFKGRALGLTHLWLPGWILLSAVVVLVLVAAISTAIGLRQIVLSPLGVRTRQQASPVHWVRIVLGLGVAVVLYGISASALSSGSLALALIMIVAVFAGGLALLNFMGPFVLKWLAGRGLRKAETPVKLLTVRTILESSKAAWRQVSSLSMTSFIAVVAGTGLSLIDSAAGSEPQEDFLVADMRTGVLITVVASFLLVAASAGVNQAASILDRSDLYLSLNRLGMPRSVMDAARKRAVLVPVRMVTLGSALLSAALVFPLTGMALILAPLSVAVIAGELVAGIALVWLALVATGPVLTKVLAQ